MATLNNINYHGTDIPLKTLVKELIGELISEGAIAFSTTANSDELKLTVNGNSTSVSLQNPIRNAVKSMVSSNLYLSVDTAGEIKLTAKDNANTSNSSTIDIDDSVQNKVASMVDNDQLYLSDNELGVIEITAKNNVGGTAYSSIEINNSIQNKIAIMVDDGQLYTGNLSSASSKVITFAENSDGDVVHGDDGFNVAAAKGNYVKYATALVPYSVSDSDENGNLQIISEQGDVTSESNAYPVRAVGTNGDLYGHTITLN